MRKNKAIVKSPLRLTLSPSNAELISDFGTGASYYNYCFVCCHPITNNNFVSTGFGIRRHSKCHSLSKSWSIRFPNTWSAKLYKGQLDVGEDKTSKSPSRRVKVRIAKEHVGRRGNRNPRKRTPNARLAKAKRNHS